MARGKHQLNALRVSVHKLRQRILIVCSCLNNKLSVCHSVEIVKMLIECEVIISRFNVMHELDVLSLQCIDKLLMRIIGWKCLHELMIADEGEEVKRWWTVVTLVHNGW